MRYAWSLSQRVTPKFLLPWPDRAPRASGPDVPINELRSFDDQLAELRFRYCLDRCKVSDPARQLVRALPSRCLTRRPPRTLQSARPQFLFRAR